MKSKFHRQNPPNWNPGQSEFPAKGRRAHELLELSLREIDNLGYVNSRFTINVDGEYVILRSSIYAKSDHTRTGQFICWSDKDDKY